MKTKTFLFCFIISLIVLQTSFFMFAMYTYDRNLTKYKIDEDKFQRAVSFACSNYLSSVLSNVDLNNDNSSSSPLAVSVEFADEIGFSSNYRGVPLCIINGATFRKGDYCPYGLIIHIGDDRLYCDSGDKRVIVRRAAIKNDQSKRRAASPCEDVRASDGQTDAPPLD